LLDVLPVIPCSAAAMEFMVLDGYVNNAGIQAKEGDVKAATAMPTAIQTANVVTIAHFLKTSTQILADGPALASQLNTLLQYGCMQKLENFVVNSTGTGTKGLLAAGTAFTATATDAADIVGEAAASLSASGYVPSAIVMNSADWFAIQSARGETEGAYLIGSPAAPIAPSLWNVPVVTSSAVPVGTAIVMDANAGCALLQRQEVTVETSLQDGDNFQRNMATVRAELRAGVMVQSPLAVLIVDLGTAPTT
jgi:HK97 family phage major capsid protein